MMMFDDDDDEEEFSFEDFSEGGEESAEPPAPEPLGDEELTLENAEPVPNVDTWLCSCGQENVGEFCVACGKPKNPSGNSQSKHSHAHRNPLSTPRPNLQPQPYFVECRVLHRQQTF